jgi:hypothetical protein
MQLDPIPKDSLKTGDILLCNIPELSFQQYMDCIWSVLTHYISTRQFSLDQATPLVHWIIGYFDECHYCHASFWLGDPELPVDPLLQKAQALVDKHWTYGFVDHIRDFLICHAPSGWQEQIERLFHDFRPQIDVIVERLIVEALEVVRKYRDRKGYVCSQTVAVIYNQAGDAKNPLGTYKITKPTYMAIATSKVQVAPPSPQEEGVAARDEMIQKLRFQLEQMPVPLASTLSAAVHTEYETWQADLLEDTFYTPRDLAESSNTELAGRLVL